MSYSCELIRHIPVLPERISPEKFRSDYSAFWSSFTWNLLHQVLNNSFKGNVEEFERWVRNGWQGENRKDPNFPVFREIISPLPDQNMRYSVSIHPDKTFLQAEENYRSDWKEYPSFYINVVPYLRRQMQPGNRYTVAKVLSNFELVELQMMGHIGGGVWLDHNVEVLAISPLSIHFRDGRLIRVHTDPDLPKGLERHLCARVNEGPLSDLWFPL